MGIVVGALVLIALTWGFVLERVRHERVDATQAVLANNDVLVLAYEQQVLRTLQLIDQAIRYVRREYQEHGPRFQVRAAFDDGALDPRLFLYAAVVDVHGRVAVSSTSNDAADVSDRDYFRFHRDSSGDELWIGQPTIGRLSGKRAIHVTRRISGPDGQFLGIALVAVAPDFLAEGHGYFKIGDSGMLLFAGLDGFARVRRTGSTITFGDDMRGGTLEQRLKLAPVGQFVSQGRADGVQRFLSYRKLAGYSFVAATGVSVEEALAGTAARAREYYIGALIASFLILLVAAGLCLAAVRGERVAMERRRAAAQYRAAFDHAAVGVAHADLAGRFLRVNAKLCQVLGYSEQELLARTWKDVTEPEGAALTIEQIRRMLEHPGVQVPEIEKCYRHKDGSRLWGTASLALVRDEGGEPDYVVTVLQDITERKRTADALAESERRFSSMLARVELISLMLDRDARITYCNDYLLRLTGWRRDEVLGRNWFELFIPAENPALKDLFASLLQDLPEAGHHESEIVTRDGGRRMIRWNNTVLRSPAGEVIGTASIGEDISEHLRAEREIAKAEARYRATFDQNAVGIAHAGLDGRFIKVNHKFASMLGYEEDELLALAAADVTHPEDINVGVEAATHQVASKRDDSFVPEYEKRYVRKDGSTLWAGVSLSLVRDETGKPDYFIAIVKDINARKLAEAKVAYQAHYDALTELPNRTLFGDRLAQTLSQARRHDWTVGVMLLDLDRFKGLNDTLGHATGDRLLREVAKRLDQCVRSGDTVARVGGDEFAVIAADLADPQDATLVAQKILDALALPFDLQGQEVFTGASIGIATFPLDGRDGDVLLKNADAAMSRAKDLGRNNYQFYTAAMNEQAMENLLLETDLRRALERDEFRLHYQPKASLADGRIVGFEALLRWERPGNGLVSPVKFVPVLEDTGLIVPVGEWVIRTVCRQLAAWRDAGAVPLPVAVNLAAKQFLQGDVAAVIDAALREHDLPASLLQVEITESDAMRNPEQTLRTLRRLQERGVGIAIDDFGTGYSSLSYVKRFPVDTLKLDRTFVKGLPQDPDDVSIALAVIKMAHSLGLEVVAEGVETPEQRAFLAQHGCDQMQGYLLARPQPAAACAELLPRRLALVAAG